MNTILTAACAAALTVITFSAIDQMGEVQLSMTKKDYEEMKTHLEKTDIVFNKIMMESGCKPEDVGSWTAVRKPVMQ